MATVTIDPITNDVTITGVSLEGAFRWSYRRAPRGCTCSRQPLASYDRVRHVVVLGHLSRCRLRTPSRHPDEGMINADALEWERAEREAVGYGDSFFTPASAIKPRSREGY